MKGSPPHVRGKESSAADEKAASRITPACAGKSVSPSRRCVHRQDHPRMCGEKALPAFPV